MPSGAAKFPWVGDLPLSAGSPAPPGTPKCLLGGSTSLFFFGHLRKPLEVAGRSIPEACRWTLTCSPIDGLFNNDAENSND